MKRLLCVVGVLLLLCACGRTGGVSEEKTVEDAVGAAVSETPVITTDLFGEDMALPGGGTTAEGSAEMPDIAAAELKPGVYVNDSARSKSCGEFSPYVALYADGTVVLYENYTSSDVELEGKYTAENGTLTLQLNGDTEYHSASFRYTQQEDVLVLQKDLRSYGVVGVSRAGDHFVLSGRSLPKKPSEVRRDLPYRQKLAQTLWDHYEVWIPSDDGGITFNNPNTRFALIDLDADGNVELVTQGRIASGQFFTHSVYRIDVRNNTVAKLSDVSNSPEGEEFSPDMQNDLQMLRLPQGKCIFIGTDYTEHAATWMRVYGVIRCEGQRIEETATLMEGVNIGDAENADGVDEYAYFDLNGGVKTEITQAEFATRRQEMQSGYTDLHMRCGFVDLPGIGIDPNAPFEMSEDQVKAKLLESYDAFGYDGYVKK